MAKITIHAGDFVHGGLGVYRLGWSGYELILATEKHRFMGESIPITQLETVEKASEENVKKIGGTVGWGLAGGALLGPVGLLAGLLAGGRKSEVTFTAQFKDGRRLLATTDSKTFTQLQSAVF